MSAEFIHSNQYAIDDSTKMYEVLSADPVSAREQTRPELEQGEYRVEDPYVITEARRMTTAVYLRKGYIQAEDIGEDGTIMPECDPYVDSSSYYISADSESRIIATTRKIHYDPAKGEESFPLWKFKHLLDEGAVKDVEAAGLEQCVEISALAKKPSLDKDKLAALRIYRSLFQDAMKRNASDETNENIFLMALRPALFEQFNTLFKGGIKRIGPNLSYPGEEIVPAKFNVPEGFVDIIHSAGDAENPEAAINTFAVDFILDGSTTDVVDPKIIQALKDNQLNDTLDKIIPSDKAAATKTEEDISEKINSEKHTLKKRLKVGAVVGAALAALAFQQSPGNEAVRAGTALSVLEATDNGAAVAGVVGGLTMAIEGGTSTLIALGLHQEKNAIKRAIQKFKKKSAPDLEGDPEEPRKRTLTTKTADIALALSIGPGIAMTKRHLEEKNPTFRKDISRGLGLSALGATVSGGIGYLMAGGIQQADKIGLEKPAEHVVAYGTDWKFWTSLIVGGYGAKWAKDKIKHSFSKKSEEQPDRMS